MPQQASTKLNQVAYVTRESLIMPEWQLVYNLKNLNDAQKLPTYSD